MDVGEGVPSVQNPDDSDATNANINTLNTVALATDALARATGGLPHIPMAAPQMPLMHSRQKSSSDLGYAGGRILIDPRLGGGNEQHHMNFARPSSLQTNSFMQMQLPRYDIELDRTLATSPTLHQHLIAPHPTDQNKLAAFQGEAPMKRPSLVTQLSATSLPPVRDLIEVANDAQHSHSRRTSSYSSIGGTDMTPSRRQSSNSVPQSPMHFSSVVYPSPSGGSHRRQDSFPSLGPTDTVSSTYHPRRVPANTHRIPPFPTSMHSTLSNGGTNSMNSIPSLSSIPSLTSVGSFESTATTTPPILSSTDTPDTSQLQGEIDRPTPSHALYPSVPTSGSYKCTFDGCKAAPFTTQYLLTYVVLVCFESSFFYP